MRHILVSTIILGIVGTPSAYGVSISALDPGTGLAPLALSSAAPKPTVEALYGPMEPVSTEPESEESVAIVPVLLHNVNSFENRIFLLSGEGELIGDSEEAVREFFMCRRSRRSHRIRRELLAVLAKISSAYPGSVIEIVSGYRRRGFGVKGSKHFTGSAIDLRVRGVPTSELRDFLWTHSQGEMGLGHYRHENFVHVDYRPREPKVAWTQRRKNSPYRYNPAWARLDNIQ